MMSWLGNHMKQLDKEMLDVQEGTSRYCCRSWQLFGEGNLSYLEHWSGVRSDDLTTKKESLLN
jgi:hypothetical protein